MSGKYHADHDDLEKISSDLEHELAEARTFFATIEADEQRWIAEGVDVDAAFAAKYYDSLDSTIEAANKQLASERLDVRGNPNQEGPYTVLFIGFALFAEFTAIVVVCVGAFCRSEAKANQKVL